MRATKLVLTVKHLTYKERLLQLKLPTLKYRRLRSDMIGVFKILTGKYDTNVTFSFEKHQDCRTRGHNLKLVNRRCHYDLRKYFFCTRIINIWNSLSESVISSSNNNNTKFVKRRVAVASEALANRTDGGEQMCFKSRFK